MVKNPAGVVLALGRAHLFRRTLRLPKLLRACGMSHFGHFIIFLVGEFCHLFEKYSAVRDGKLWKQLAGIQEPHWLSIPIYRKKWNNCGKVRIIVKASYRDQFQKTAQKWFVLRHRRHNLTD